MIDRDTQDEAECVDDRGLARKAADWARAHPFQTALHVGTGLVIVAPAAVVAPVLGAVGFGAGGLVGGTAATAYQASHGPIVARGIFATLQSAGAGGYGVPIVHGIVRAGGALASALSFGVAKACKKEQPTATGNGSVGSGDEEDDSESNYGGQDEKEAGDTADIDDPQEEPSVE
ncbi:MAG: hypothetical protein Q9218_004408, partial [Villophora microphyllina]